MQTSTFYPYARMIAVLACVSAISTFAPHIFAFFADGHESELELTFFSIATIFSLSFAIFYLAKSTPIPNFVVAIFFGIAARPFLQPIIDNGVALSSLVGFGATLILFGGGLETPFGNFKKLLPKILSLSFFGLLLTAVLFSFVSVGLGQAFHIPLSVTAAVLLGALLASTDPAAIIPILKRLRFKCTDTKDIVVSESAVTDVTGTLLTVAFLAILSTGATLGNSVFESYSKIFSPETGIFLLEQLGFGIFFGVVGYLLLRGFTYLKSSHDREYEVDSAFFLFIPIIIFTLALAVGGSGYLAAFIAGLLYSVSDKLHQTERFFNHIIDGFFKPTIFLLLGALVDLPLLLAYAPLGIAAALIFMFVIRPLSVFVTLWPLSRFGGTMPLSVKDVLFISFVRETGAIPAVLLVTIAAAGISGIEGLLPVGMWVILLTLIVEPPLTPWVATKLAVADVIPEGEGNLHVTSDSFVVLGSRGRSFPKRLPFVATWAEKHHIDKITLLLCLENAYRPESVVEIKAIAQQSFDAINNDRSRRGLSAIHFSFISHEGLLQDSIDELAKGNTDLVAVFVGKKMLDFYLEDVKKLSAPLLFVD
ncbi:cation:proton antiporter [Patescibacteria group bacterium]|nr:cation:proton antiporter [Patescibacteria group bacterium]